MPVRYLWLLLAGFGGGLTGSVAGLASLVSYPALLGVGISPVSANVSNTVALLFNSVGSVWGSQPELAGQRTLARGLAGAAVAGGALGAALLLLTPGRIFERVVPVLIGVGSLAILVPRRPHVAPSGHRKPRRELIAAVLAVSLYGGYFGAAGGVIMLAVLLFSTGEPLPRSNAMKNLLLGLANGVAAVGFAVFGPVRWAAALPLAVGFLAGGRLGPAIVRRVPATPIRVLICVAGLGLAVQLGLSTYR
ncbi:MAG: sulfite exporter TauE/SafE family protein [Acidobacteriota bacterium]|nr:sulfite exporter TauE/SafE family protein [Acidobacteriota bacterium]